MFTIPIHMIIDRTMEKLKQPSEKYKMINIAGINTKISLLSAVIIFLTGALMTEISWGWSPSAGTVWLVIKQTIWLILLIGILVLMRPLYLKLEQLIDENGNEETILSTYRNLKIRGHILTTFIVINIFLATTKPF